jgi:hypothetical protein
LASAKVTTKSFIPFGKHGCQGLGELKKFSPNLKKLLFCRIVFICQIFLFKDAKIGMYKFFLLRYLPLKFCCKLSKIVNLDYYFCVGKNTKTSIDVLRRNRNPLLTSIQKTSMYHVDFHLFTKTDKFSHGI